MRIKMKIQKNYTEIKEKLRKEYYGSDSIASDYTTSYLIGTAIDRFELNNTKDLLVFLDEDSSVEKISQTITLKGNTYERLKAIAAQLNIGEARALRLIVFYTCNLIEKKSKPNVNKEKSIVKEAFLIKINKIKQEVSKISDSLEALSEELESMEKKIKEDL